MATALCSTTFASPGSYRILVEGRGGVHCTAAGAEGMCSDNCGIKNRIKSLDPSRKQQVQTKVYKTGGVSGGGQAGLWDYASGRAVR